MLGESAQGEGVRGVSHHAHSGVVGVNDFAPRIHAGPVGNGGWFESTQGEGVRGWAKGPNHAGAAGINTAGGIGVYGSSEDQRTIAGEPGTPAGGWFESTEGDGVRGTSGSREHAAVVGVNSAKGTAVLGTSEGEGVRGETAALDFVAGVTGVAIHPEGIGPGVLGITKGSGPGVVGKSERDNGVIGFHGEPNLQEVQLGRAESTAGVFGASDVGPGILGYARNPEVPAILAFGGMRSVAMTNRLAGDFEGDVRVNGQVNCEDVILSGEDCAEHFNFAPGSVATPGDLVVIDDDGNLDRSAIAYDRRVAGVVSGAGSFEAGIVLGHRSSADGRMPVALLGKVFCNADATFGSIKIGDLLTTSDTPGHAMRATDQAKCFGAVVGKSLASLSFGCGLLPILVCLQ